MRHCNRNGGFFTILAIFILCILIFYQFPSLTLLEKRNFINADKIWLFL